MLLHSEKKTKTSRKLSEEEKIKFYSQNEDDDTRSRADGVHCDDGGPIIHNARTHGAKYTIHNRECWVIPPSLTLVSPRL